MPTLINQERRANAPSPITTIPADLKKSGAQREPENDADQNERRARTGNVPRENANIMSPPEKNDPLDRAAICMD